MPPKAAKDLPIISLDDLLAVQDLPEEVVPVPEWNASVKVRGFSLKTQQDLMDDATVDGEFDDNLHSSLLLIHGIVEPELTVEHVEALRGKSLAGLNRVATAINRCNGAGGDALTTAEREFLAE